MWGRFFLWPSQNDHLAYGILPYPDEINSATEDGIGHTATHHIIDGHLLPVGFDHDAAVADINPRSTSTTRMPECGTVSITK